MQADRRRLIQAGFLALSLGAAQLARGANMLAVRIWPAPDYSRVTLESDTPLKTTQTFVASPPRLAVDIEGIELNAALKELVAKVRADDPYIAGVRVGQYQARVVRLVIDLKQRGIGVLITDHNVRETLDIVDRACIIYDGRVLFEGTPEALVADETVRRVYLGEGFAL